MLRDVGPNDNLADKECPKCGCKGNFAYHGSYMRHLVGIDGERLVAIKRVRCMSCRATHALIPPDVVPYRIYCASFISALAISWASGASNACIEQTLEIAPSSRRRLLSAAICDLCMALKAPSCKEQMARALKGFDAQRLSALCLHGLSHAISEHARLPNLHQLGASWPAPST